MNVMPRELGVTVASAVGLGGGIVGKEVGANGVGVGAIAQPVIKMGSRKKVNFQEFFVCV
jgi:hypothetical protein